MLTHQYSAACQTEAEGLLRDLQTAAFESDRVVVVDDPFLLLRKDLLQIPSWIGKKRCSRLLGLDTKTGVVQLRPVLPEKIIRRFQRGDLAQTKLLRQSALPGAEQPLTPSPCLRGIGQDQVNNELLQCPPDLGGTLWIPRLPRFGRPRHVASSIRIERTKQAALLDHPFQRRHDRGRRFFINQIRTAW